MNKFAMALATVAALSMPGLANAAACRDAHGRFTKCGTAPAAPAAHATPAAAHAAPAHPVAMHAAVSHPAAGAAARCRNAKNQFAKCGTPGAHPV